VPVANPVSVPRQVFLGAAPQSRALPQGVAEPVQLADKDDLASLIETIQQLPEPPVLVIIDTLHRCFGDGDENSSRDYKRFIDGADDLRRATGATVFVIHHTGYDQSHARGSSSGRAAMDTLMQLSRDGNGNGSPLAWR
jgi:RecA-family ATPase